MEILQNLASRHFAFMNTIVDIYVLSTRILLSPM